MPEAKEQYLDLVADAVREGRVRIGQDPQTGHGVLSVELADTDGERWVAVADLVPRPPAEMPSVGGVKAVA